MVKMARMFGIWKSFPVLSPIFPKCSHVLQNKNTCAIFAAGRSHPRETEQVLAADRSSRDGSVSQKPEKATGEQKKKRQRKKRTKQTITRAVTHIRLIEANPGKLDALDALMTVYLPLCQHYTTLFCELETGPDKYSDPVFETLLSDRLHRVAMQQAAGIAKSFRTNRANAYQAYLENAADYAQARAKAEAEGRMSTFKRKEPVWREWKLPHLRVPVMQANANVVVVEKSQDSTFDYWLRISTLHKGTPLRVPVKLAPYHKQVLKDRLLNTSTTLRQQQRGLVADALV